MDFSTEKYYKDKIAELEREIRSLKNEYASAHKVEEGMARQIAAQQRIIEKRNTIIKKYVSKYGLLEES